MHSIYLDHNATTPVLPDVLAVMLPYFRLRAGNPSSSHTSGAEARDALEQARDHVARLVGAPASYVLFTSSATEAINTAYNSVLRTLTKPPRIVISSVEHAAVRECSRFAADLGAELIEVPVSSSGALSLDHLDEAISGENCLVSIMWANNETGVLFPISEIAQLCSDRGACLHVDAVQCAGKVPINLEDIPIDYLSISSHKLFGPKGAGALIARPRLIHPIVLGGGQEMSRRAGTENVPAIVGFGEAARLASLELDERADTASASRDYLEGALIQSIPGSYVNGEGQPRLPNTSNIGFEGVRGDTLAGVLDADGIYVSTGSACSANTLTNSHVIMAMSGSYDRAGEALRFSLSHLNTQEEIEQTISAVQRSVASLRRSTTCG